MKPLMFTIKTKVLGLLAGTVLLFSCNKDLPVATPIVTTPSSNPTIMTLLDGANFSYLKAAVTRAGLNTALANASNIYTVFAPDNAAFIASGIPSIDVINTLPPATLNAIISYHLVGGQLYFAAGVNDKFPNMYLQSSLLLQAPSASLPPGYRMPLCPSRRANTIWANNIPVKQVDIAASNGVVHVVAGLVMPPDSVVAQIITRDPSYSYLAAAIARADSGFTAPNRLIDVLGNAAANLTLMAPTDLAFQQTLTFMITQALVGQGMDPATALATATALASTPAVFSNPALFGSLTATTVRGLIAYHVIGRVSASPTNSSLVGRVFSVNIPSTASPVNTLLVPAPNVGPVPVILQNTAGTVTVKGMANPAAATVTTANKHAINGVIHRINGVLFPQ
jgi:uncharacterized surface protein with fasciclin (FAS1) repeats